MLAVQQEVDAEHPDGSGVLGLGLRVGSAIFNALNSSQGNTALDNIFKQGSSDATTMSLLLTRTTNSSNGVPGQLSVGEVISGRDDVSKMPRLTVDRNSGDQNWMVLLDDGGMVGASGNPFNGTKGTQLKAVFNSVYTLSQVPKYVFLLPC